MAVHAHVRTSAHIYAPTTPRGGYRPEGLLAFRDADKRFLNKYYWRNEKGHWVKIVGVASSTDFLAARCSSSGAIIGDRFVLPVEGMFANRFADKPFKITRH